MCMKTNIMLQARMSSNRLPNKVLKPILGKPMLAHQIARLKNVKNVDKIIVVTSNETTDDAIADLCNTIEVNCFRGDLHNVLDRFYQASQQYLCEHIVRLTGDCPLIDANVVDNVIALHQVQNFDYTSNCEPATFPDGLDVEVMTAQALKSAWSQARKPSELEHVTPFIRNNPQQYNCGSYMHACDLSSHRWTVDEKEDFDFVEKIYQGLYSSNKSFNLNDILKYLEKHPELVKINQSFSRNEGLLKSQIIDKEQGYV